MIPLWMLDNLGQCIENWRLLIVYTSLTTVYVEISTRYFKPDLS